MISLAKDLITGNTRWWGPTQRRQYHSILGHFRYVGIEWEAHVDKKRHNPDKLNQLGFCSTSCGNGKEWVYLFDVSDPYRLIEDMKLRHIQLWRNGMNTLGGVHLNFQIERSKLEKYGARQEIAIQTDIIGNRITHSRAETKYGYPYRNWYELLVQMFYYAVVIEKNKKTQIQLPPGLEYNLEMEFIVKSAFGH